jgi:hypothetical protein
MTINHENGNGEPEDGLLAALLTAYGQAELDPDPAAVDRTRRAVMAAAQRRDPRARPARRVLGGLAGWGGRRPALALVAALLGLLALAGGTLAASRAGGPLYDARLWVESLSLPSEPGGRVDADLARLQTRLDEATDAASQGNGAAVQAALDAYRGIVDDALAFTGNDLTREVRLRLELERHRVVLETLAGLLPAPAADALNRVLERENGAVRTIDEHTQGKPNANSQGAGSSGGGADQGSGGGAGQGSGGGAGQGSGGGAGGTDGGTGSGGGAPASTPGTSHAPPSAHPSPPAHSGSQTP